MVAQQERLLPRAGADRAAKIRWLSQSHLEPGMNLSKFEFLMAQHGLTEAKDWQTVADETLDQMIAEVHHLAQTDLDAGPSASGAYAWEPHLGEHDA